MSRRKSRIPPELFSAMTSVSRDSARYVEGLDRLLPARTDLAGGSTLAQVITAVNLLYADMRDAGMMES